MAQASQAKVKVTEINQIAIVVRDLQKTMEYYWNTLGIGPWDIYTFQAPLVTDMTYHGKPAQYRMKLALTMVGSVMLELIEPLEGDNIYSDFMKEHGEGLHHLGFFVKNMDETVQTMEKEGFPCLQSGHFDGGGYGYLDTVNTLKAIFEPIQMPEVMPPPEARWPE